MRLLRRFRYFLRQRKLEADLSEELEFHRAMKEREMAGSGAEDPAYAARRELGNVTLAREDARAVWIAPWIESVWQDVRYGVCSLRREPSFTLAALAALSLAIGLNTSLFTVFNALALRPWPVKDPGRVVTVLGVVNRGARSAYGGFSLAEYRYLRDHASSLSGLVVTRGEPVRFGDEPAARPSRAGLVSGNFFSVLGVQMERGRAFLPGEDVVDAPEAAAVLSHATWESRFGADPAIVGRQVRLDGTPFTVIGVASRDFTGIGTGRVDIWIPFPSLALLRPSDPSVGPLLHTPGWCCSELAARLAPGVTRPQAAAELTVLNRRFQAANRTRNDGVVLSGTAFIDNPSSKAAQAIPVFALMFLGLTMVLLLACANVGNLLLARGVARRREIAVRLSLGAGRRRLVRQLLTESLVLAGAAGVIGIGLACVLPGYVVRSVAAEPISVRLSPDAAALCYTAALACAACILFGLAPALYTTRVNVAGALKQAGAAGAFRISLRSLLLAAQVALSVVLLVGAGLMVRGVERIRSVDPGFAIAGIDIVNLARPGVGFHASGDRARAFVAQLSGALAGVPGIGTFGLAGFPPLSAGRSTVGFRLPGDPESAPMRAAGFNQVSAGYFDLLRIPVLKGRNFEPGDVDRRVVIVNESFAGRYWPAGGGIGKLVQLDDTWQVVGVVKDAQTVDLGQTEPTIYIPVRTFLPVVLVRVGNPEFRKAIEAAVAGVDPKIVVGFTPLSENLARWMAPMRMGAAIAAALGVLALVLASIGIFGVFVYFVQHRTPEIGVRIALGARPANVFALVIASSGRPVLLGLVAGFVFAAALSGLLQHHLVGLSHLDPVSYAAVAVVLAVSAALATYLPARRAARIDPVAALRYE